MFKRKYISKDQSRTGGQSKKFGNKKTIVDEHQFDSKFEAQVFTDLKLMVQAELIKKVIPHPEHITICPSHKVQLANGTNYLIRELTYRPDFLIILNDKKKEPVYIETKSFATLKEKDWIDKYKMLVHYIGVNPCIITQEMWKFKYKCLDLIISGNWKNYFSKSQYKKLF